MNDFREQHIQKIARIRKSRNMSQRQLSKLTGINREALILWEKKGKEPMLRPSQIHRLLSVLDCKLVEILEIEEVTA